MPRSKLQAFRDLTLDERRFLIQAWFALPIVDIGLRLLPFRTVQKFASASQKQRSVPVSSRQRVIDDLQKYAELVRIASHTHLFTLTCLRQSLTLQWLLARRGIKTDLQLGVRKDEGSLQAHAWLTYNGLPILSSDNVEERFTSLLSTKDMTLDN